MRMYTTFIFLCINIGLGIFAQAPYHKDSLDKQWCYPTDTTINNSSLFFKNNQTLEVQHTESKLKDGGSEINLDFTSSLLLFIALVLCCLIYINYQYQSTILDRLKGKADNTTLKDINSSILEIKEQGVDQKIDTLQNIISHDVITIKKPVDNIFQFLNDQIPLLQKQDDDNNKDIPKQLETLEKSLENHLDKNTKQVYDKVSYFLTPYMMSLGKTDSPNVRELGEFLKLESSEDAAKDFHLELNKVETTRQELKNKMLKLTESEKQLEDNIVNEALERLRKYKQFVLLIGEEIADRFELASEIDLFHQDPKKLETLSPEKIKEEKQRAKESYGSGRRLLNALTKKSKLAEKFESELGTEFNEELHRVRRAVPNDDPSKNQTIYKSLSPGIKMGKEVIIPQRVVYYENA